MSTVICPFGGRKPNASNYEKWRLNQPAQPNTDENSTSG